MVDVLGILVSALPFVVAAVGLVGLGWPASWAGAASLAAAVLGALVWPGLQATAVPGALLGGLGTSAQVLYVLFGGLLLYNLLSAGGAVEAVSRFLGRLEPDRVALAAGVVVGVAPFFESVTGFGVAVVISAPILLAAGFTPLGRPCWRVGASVPCRGARLGVGTVIGANLAGMGFGTLSDASAFLSLPLFPVYGVAAVALAGGWTGVRRRGAEAIVLGLVAGAGTLLTSLYLVPELSGAVGGLAATAVFLARRRRPARRGSRARAAPLRVPARAARGGERYRGVSVESSKSSVPCSMVRGFRCSCRARSRRCCLGLGGGEVGAAAAEDSDAVASDGRGRPDVRSGGRGGGRERGGGAACRRRRSLWGLLSRGLARARGAWRRPHRLQRSLERVVHAAPGRGRAGTRPI